MDKLYSYQIQHTENIIRIIKNNNAVLDASDTGTGKTYCAVVACKMLNLEPFVICPKAVMSTWKNVCNYFNVKYTAIVNYDTIKLGKFYLNGKRRKCPYIEVDEKTCKWDLPNNCILIFDEAHKCSELSTQNAKLLIGAKDTKIPVMILSATIADHPEKFKLFFYVLNFIEPTQIQQLNINYIKYIRIVESWIARDLKPMVRIHKMLYPDRATRMRIDVIDSFPETQITATPYSMGEARELEIEKEYKTLALSLDELRGKAEGDKKGILPKMMRAHQKIELLKVPTFVELTNDFIQNGFSVVIFVNFTETLKKIGTLLHTDNFIFGEQSYDDREDIIQRFQENKIRVIICNIKAGGVGVSLHDLQGGHPRISLISPTWSSIDLVQALGRIHRAGSKTKSLQRIIYAANTVEEKIADKLKVKLANINSLNNGDLDLSNINFDNNIQKF
jgi:superfamily II DNA or RNA helicase